MPDFDCLVTLWVTDANDTPMPLVELFSVPTDGTWEVLKGNGAGGMEWKRLDPFDPLESARWGGSLALVVARPIGSDT